MHTSLKSNIFILIAGHRIGYNMTGNIISL